MQLVVDVGNTETVIGLASGKRELAGHWRISSSVSRTIDEMTVLVRAFLSNNALGDSKITRGVVGSVVPTVNRVWTKTLRRIVTGEVLVIDPRSDLPIELDVEEPMSVGADRIVDLLPAPLPSQFSVASSSILC
jgi:type III pantothenate kinase